MSGDTVAPVRHLGRAGLVTVGLNSVIGGGIFILPANAAALAGSSSLFAYLAAGLVVLGVGTTLGRLAARFETSGGPYAYVEQAFGPLAGFQVGWLFCLARLTAMANLLNGVALYLGALAPALRQPAARAAVILACAAAVTALDIGGIRQTAGASNLFAILKVAPLLIVGLAGLTLVEASRLAPGPVPPAAFLRAVLLLMFAFTGFEILTVPAEESLRPRVDMPRALLMTVGIVCGVYLLVHTAALGGLADLAGETAPLATLAGSLFGSGGRLGMTGVAALSMAGCSLVSLFGATRVLYAMSAQGRIPAGIGALDPRRRTPFRAALLTGSLAAALAILGGYAFLAAVSSGTRLLIYLGCCLACLSGRDRVVPLLTGTAIVVLLFRLEPREALFGMIGIGAGWVLYLLAGRGRRLAAKETT